MAAPTYISRDIMDRILEGKDPKERLHQLTPRVPTDEPLPPRIPRGNDHSVCGLETRRGFLEQQGVSLGDLGSAAPGTIRLSELQGNIENLIGFAELPVGAIGPLRVNGTCAFGDFYVPMATTEGALIASCNRGAYAISQSGGAAAACLTESVSRAPCFVFKCMSESGRFLAWALDTFDSLQHVVEGTSSHCRLVDVKTSIIGKEVYLIFEYTTGDASGQNMVTMATDAVCRYLVEHTPVQPVQWYVEGNMSGDKKATMMAFTYARGKKVVAETVIRKKVLKRFLHTDPQEMIRYWEISFMGGAQSGSIGVQGHYANTLAALFIACGQDAACVSEASVGMTRMDLTDEGNLYVSVSLPNLIVGTVGGGTHLPSARACLHMLDCQGTGNARKFAEICAATALAGEISIIAALAAGEFARAHSAYGRRTKPPSS